MGGLQIAECLPEGVELVFCARFSKACFIGKTIRNSSFHSGREPNNNMGIVFIHNDEKKWVSVDAIDILKLNPTPQQKMYYMLKGAECLPD